MDEIEHSPDDFDWHAFVDLTSDYYQEPMDEDGCLDYVMYYRYPGEYFDGKITCPHCKKNATYNRVEGEPAYVCELCANEVRPLEGTIFERSSTPLKTWVECAIFMYDEKPSVRQLARKIGVPYNRTWHMKEAILRLEREGSMTVSNRLD